MKSYRFRYIICGAAVLCVVAVIVGVIVFHRYKSQNNTVLSADDVGITALMNQKIVSASYEYHIPTPEFNYDCENLEEILSLLNTIKDAEFKPTGEPKSPIYTIARVHGETENGSFCFGVWGGAFAVYFNHECKYYTCSAQNDYMYKLFEIQEHHRSSNFES